MKNTTGLLLVMLSALSLHAQAKGVFTRQDMSQVTAESGNVHFHGRVYVSPCVLDMASRDQSIDLGDISAGRFHRAGDRSRPVMFTVRLKDCLKGASETIEDFPAEMSGRLLRARGTGEQGVTVRFTGEGDIRNTDLVKVQGDVQGAGLRLMTKHEDLLDINKDQHLYLINPGDNVLTFLAALESTQRTVTSGEFHGLVRMELEYL
ncbi:type 1 fimbrial protein [Klebsiella sp. T2.Ur]|nr:type 1 fimbrial protein [Klebsiella sp. T2.Ur]